MIRPALYSPAFDEGDSGVWVEVLEGALHLVVGEVLLLEAILLYSLR